jgi:serine/threonine protein kinase
MICPACKSENPDSADSCFTCGRGLTGTAPIIKGSVIASRYEIRSQLGKGGMGVVYKAHDRVLDEEVAFKVLRGETGQKPEMARRFRQEIKLARKVRHPNVCAIHEYGEEGDLRYIAMELVEGTDLKKVLRQRGPLPPREAIEIAIHIAHGLQAIHDVGIIHRDLKTPNVMLDSRGAVRLMDFGIAKRVDAQTSATATGLIIGTPEYMSPEQARGDKVDYRSDVYSLGIVMFEMFTGQVPFQADTPLATVLKHLHEAPPLDGPAAARIPPDAKRVLAKALAKNPGDRHVSAEELARELEALLGHPPRARLRATRSAVAAEPASEPRTEEMSTPVPTAVPTKARTAAVPATAGTVVPRAAAPTLSESSRPVVRSPRGPSRHLLWIAPAAATAVAVALWLASREPEVNIPAAAVQETPAAATPQPIVPSSPPKAKPAPIPAEEEVPIRIAPADSPLPRTQRAAPPTVATSAPTLSRTRTPFPASAAPPLPAAQPTVATAEPRVAPPPTTTAAAPATAVSVVPATPEPRVVPPPSGRGLLSIKVKPDAEISVDGTVVGRMGTYTAPLAAGPHVVVFTHPKYQPLTRKVDIQANEKALLTIELKDDAIPRKK